MGTMTDTPFGPPVAEVPLARAPLVFVVAQARFERLASISSEAFIADFQEAIRPIYPIMRREQQASIWWARMAGLSLATGALRYGGSRNNPGTGR